MVGRETIWSAAFVPTVVDSMGVETENPWNGEVPLSEEKLTAVWRAIFPEHSYEVKSLDAVQHIVRFRLEKYSSLTSHFSVVSACRIGETNSARKRCVTSESFSKQNRSMATQMRLKSM